MTNLPGSRPASQIDIVESQE